MDTEAKNGFITELEKVIEVQSSANFEDMKNNKVGDGKVEEEEPEKMFSAQSQVKKEKQRSEKIVRFLLSLAVLHITMGVLVLILNVIFIYDGMNSGWYYFKDSLGTELKVISIGEGIMTGVFFITIASLAIVILSRKSFNKSYLYLLYVIIIILSFSLIITTACQIGLIHQFVPVSELSSANQAYKLDMLLKEEARQTAVVAVQTVAYFLVFISSVVCVILVPTV